MSPVGYSGAPLAKKLGIGAGASVALVNAPDGFEGLLDPLPAGVTLRRGLRGKPDVTMLFTTAVADLAKRIDRLGQAVYPDRALWVAWPKRTSRVATDMSENAVREVALPIGLVDTKVCAIDDTWSGLRLVWRVQHRPR